MPYSSAQGSPSLDGTRPLTTINSAPGVPRRTLLPVPEEDQHRRASASESDDDDEETPLVIVPPDFPFGSKHLSNDATRTPANVPLRIRILQIVKDQVVLAVRFMGLANPERIAALVVMETDDGVFTPQLVITHRKLHMMFCEVVRWYLKQQRPEVDVDHILFRNNGLPMDRFLFNLPDGLAAFRIVADHMVFESVPGAYRGATVQDIRQGVLFIMILSCVLAIFCFAPMLSIANPLHYKYQQAVMATAVWIRWFLHAVAALLQR